MLPTRVVLVGLLACVVLISVFTWLSHESTCVSPSSPDSPKVLSVHSSNFTPSLTSLLESDSNGREILELYQSFKDGLIETRERVWNWRFFTLGKTKMCYGSLSDMEAELLYLRIRKRRPNLVLEIAPLCGLSTMYILSALKDNGVGTLYSFDLIPNARELVDKDLAKDRWVFTQGDVTTTTYSMHADKAWDFIFMDAAHTSEFAKWYTANVFAPHLRKIVEEQLPPTPVQVHDIYSPALFHPGRQCFLPDPSQSYDAMYPYFPAPPEFHLRCLQRKGVNASAPSPEGRVVLSFLDKCASGQVARGGISRNVFDISYFSRRDLWDATAEIRKKVLGLGEWNFINVNYINPSIYFEFALQE